jgi:hypothetical protein
MRLNAARAHLVRTLVTVAEACAPKMLTWTGS